MVWAASRHIGQVELMATPRLLPVRLTRAFTGSDRQLLVSPQHGVLVRHKGAEVLARSAHLARLGIAARATRLAMGLSGSALENHLTATRRLTAPAEMGTLFKAMAIRPPHCPFPPGFA